MRTLRALAAKVWRLIKWPVRAGAVGVLILVAPVGYVEITCRGSSSADTYQPLITDPAFQRREANTYLTYPEWHIVYAYDGLAEALKAGDEHDFDYLPSIAGFWSSTCALMEVADAHGGADFNTRVMIHTIGVSFTAEMALKAAYEETLGRAAAWLRGGGKTLQDQIITATAADYAAFLRQTPWYRYPFTREARKLWSTPAGWSLRGWERRLAMSAEFGAKAAYARAIGAGVAATAPAQLIIRSVVSGLSEAELAAIPDVRVVATRGEGIEIETPRYDLFTRILVEIARRGGTIVEIAGNDDIMVTVTVPRGSPATPQGATLIARLPRDGFPSDRLILNVRVRDLATFLNANQLGDPGLEHVFDY
jgi:hypothetical protein